MKRLPLAVAAFVLACSFVSKSVSAGAGQEVSDDLLAELDAPEFERRERAGQQLSELLDAAAALEDPQIAQLIHDRLFDFLRRGDATTEQRNRIIDAFRQRFASSPRAAMGISFGTTNNLGVQILGLINGFPAARDGQVRVGDYISSIDGISVNQALAQQAALGGGGNQGGIPNDGWDLSRSVIRELIISHDPGEVIDVGIVRLKQVQVAPQQLPRFDDLQNMKQAKRALADLEIETLQVRVELGSYASLPNQAMLAPAVLDRAWVHRMERMGIPFEERRVMQWQVAPTVWDRHRRLRQPNPAVNLAPVTELAGAMEHIPTSGYPGQFTALSRRIEDRVIAAPEVIELLRAKQRGPLNVVQVDRADQRAKRLATEMEVLSGMRSIVQDMELRSKSTTLTPEERAAMNEQLIVMRQELEAKQLEVAELMKLGEVNPLNEP